MNQSLLHVARRGLPLAVMALAACAGVTNSTTAVQTWKDPNFRAAPLPKVFVISLMEVEPGGRAPVEDAMVAALNAAGVQAVAAHKAMAAEAATPQPTLTAAIRNSGAEGVVMIQLKRLMVDLPGMVRPEETASAPVDEVLGNYSFYSNSALQRSDEYKVARIDTRLYSGALVRQIWGAVSDSNNASDLSRNLPDYTRKMVAAMSKDGVIAAKPAAP